MAKKYLQIEDFDIYQIAFNLSNYLWYIYINWDYYIKETIGKQFIRAVDSISSILAEGYNRYGKKTKYVFIAIVMLPLRSLWIGMKKYKSENYCLRSNMFI